MTAPTGLACPSCDAATAAGDLFCEACGSDLPATDARVQEAPTAAPAPPGPACPSCGAGATDIVDGYCGMCGIKQPAPRDHIETAAAGVAAVTDRGRRHHRNEDAFAFTLTNDGRLAAVVCDGVSTTVNPDQASQQAVDAAVAVLAAPPLETPDALHAQAFSAAREAVLGVAWAPAPELGPPSCTYLAATIKGSAVEMASLGDCRAYWLPADGPAETLTEDDSWAANQIGSGAMTAEEAFSDPQAHTITRWIAEDADPLWSPRRYRMVASGPGRLLLCSDGLWNYANLPEEVVTAAGEGALMTVARRLVDHANEQGGSDNITVLLVDLPLPPKGPTP